MKPLSFSVISKYGAQLLIATMLVIISSCHKLPLIENGPPPPPPPNHGGDVPDSVPAGTPLGDPQSFSIGPQGGEFHSADERITIVFPVGAVSSETTFSIQPVQSGCPGASGAAWNISPHVSHFDKPVKIQFHYDDGDLINTIPLGLCIAYQDQSNKWNVADQISRDTAARIVTVATDHFSGWSLFRSIEMTPAASVLEPGGSVNLIVEAYADLKGDSLLPIPGPVTKKNALVKNWKIGGPGELTPMQDVAKYTAPASIPTTNPVAVSAEINTSGTTKFFLVSNIYIGREGLTFRIDNGPWLHGPSTGVISTGYNNEFTAAITNTPQNDGVTISWMGDANLNKSVSWGTAFPGFLYGEHPTVNYMQLLAATGKPSPGCIYFYQAWKNPAAPYVIGTFYLQPAQKISINSNGIPSYSTHRIEGFFKVKWQ